MKALFAYAYISGLLWLLGWEIAAFAINKTMTGPQIYTLSDLTWNWEQIPEWTPQRLLILGIGIFLTLHLSFKWFH